MRKTTRRSPLFSESRALVFEGMMIFLACLEADLNCIHHSTSWHHALMANWMLGWQSRGIPRIKYDLGENFINRDTFTSRYSLQVAYKSSVFSLATNRRTQPVYRYVSDVNELWFDGFTHYSAVDRPDLSVETDSIKSTVQSGIGQNFTHIVTLLN